VVFLYGRAGRLTVKNGGFRPGQADEQKVLQFIKAHRTKWIAWLGKKDLYSQGADPSRQTAGIRNEFYELERSAKAAKAAKKAAKKETKAPAAGSPALKRSAEAVVSPSATPGKRLKSTEPIDLQAHVSAEALLVAVGKDAVTKELTRLGLRTGGKPEDRARRLMETKGKNLAEVAQEEEERKKQKKRPRSDADATAGGAAAAPPAKKEKVEKVIRITMPALPQGASDQTVVQEAIRQLSGGSGPVSLRATPGVQMAAPAMNPAQAVVRPAPMPPTFPLPPPVPDGRCRVGRGCAHLWGPAALASYGEAPALRGARLASASFFPLLFCPVLL
jgi:hypothetical protein